MENPQSDDAMIRQYLLGRLDAATDVVERLDERMLVDAEFSELVDVVEDEIIEEYLEGSLDPAERHAVEKHFLQPPERREKLRLARLLHRDLELRGSNLAAQQAKARKSSAANGSWQSHFRTYAELAACLALIVSAGYIINLRRELQSGVAQSNQELAQERARRAELEQRLEGMKAVAQPSLVTLSLLQPGVRFSGGPQPTLVVGSETKTIHVEIVLKSASSGPFDVRLETLAGKAVGPQTQQWPFKSPNSSLLILDVPAHDVGPGDYQFVITERRAGETTYPFHISRP